MMDDEFIIHLKVTVMSNTIAIVIKLENIILNENFDQFSVVIKKGV